MKQPENKLDPFATRLAQSDAEGKALADIKAELAKEGCQADLPEISSYLDQLRLERLLKQFLGLIELGGKMNRELDEAFKKNPAPHIERLIDVTKTLVMALQAQGSNNPKFLDLANAMHQTVLKYLTARTEVDLETRKLDLSEKREAARSETERQKLELESRRVKVLEEKAAQADLTREVTTSDLTDEEKQERIKQILGIAP